MSSVPATELTDGHPHGSAERAAPHVRTYLLPCVLSLVLFFPTAIPGIVHGVKARRLVHERQHPRRAGPRRGSRASGSG